MCERNPIVLQKPTVERLVSVMRTGVVYRPVRSRGAPGLTPEVVRGAVGATAAVTTAGAGSTAFTNWICGAGASKPTQHAWVVASLSRWVWHKAAWCSGACVGV